MLKRSLRADVFPIFRLLPNFLAPWRVECRKLHERCVIATPCVRHAFKMPP